MTFLDATSAGLATEGSAGVPVVDPGAASGVFSLLWLIIALPGAGALVLLLGGAMFDKAISRWAHLFGSATVLGSFVLSLTLFFGLLGRDEGERQVGQHLFTWFEAGRFNVGMDLLYDPLTALFLLRVGQLSAEPSAFVEGVAITGHGGDLCCWACGVEPCREERAQCAYAHGIKLARVAP